MLPPLLAEAPVPTRYLTNRLTGSYSAWSSPAASVLGPAFGPFRTTIEFGTYAVLISSVSVMKQLTATSEPMFFPEMVYSRISPGATAPPFRSFTNTVARKSGS